MCTWMRERVLFALLADLFPWMVTTCHHDRWSKCRKREMVDSMAYCSSGSGGARIKIYLWRRREAVKGREPRRQPRATNQRAMATCTSIFGSSASGKWVGHGLTAQKSKCFIFFFLQFPANQTFVSMVAELRRTWRLGVRRPPGMAAAMARHIGGSATIWGMDSGDDEAGSGVGGRSRARASYRGWRRRSAGGG